MQFSKWVRALFLLIAYFFSIGHANAQDVGVEFFESRIRPILIEHCYACHNSSDQDDGGLVLDFRQGLLEGGDSGPAIVPGNAGKSLLLAAIQHSKPKLRMPQKNAKLSASVIADFEKWIEMGAPDPRDKPPTPEALANSISWETIRDKRKQWWSFQPVSNPQLPVENRWSNHDVDRFIYKRLNELKLDVAANANDIDLIRRAAFVITGLPPTPGQLQEFLDDTSPGSYERMIDRLLESPQFGERWARHWMDWVRFAESHGSEGDPAIPFAFQYRDYLIRAFNADIPYDQLVREHIAGDLIESPRINKSLGINESKIGLGHYRFVEHGYGPTDAMAEQVRFTENQIDVITKSFLGLTVSCARCHDHKFDAISDEDFYSLYGIMTSCRASLITVDTQEKLDTNKAQLAKIKVSIKSRLAKKWMDSLDNVEAFLDGPFLALSDSATDDENNNQKLTSEQKLINAAVADPSSPIHLFAKVRDRPAEEVSVVWRELKEKYVASSTSLKNRHKSKYETYWDLRHGGSDWFRHGNGLANIATPAGGFRIEREGDAVVADIYPAGVYTNLLSDKHNGIFTSPTFDISQEELWVRVAGGGNSRVRYVVQNYPRVSGPVYHAHNLNDKALRWVRWDMKYWLGEECHIEIATANDIPVEARRNDRSWFGITEVIAVGGEQVRPKDEMAEFVQPLFEILLRNENANEDITVAQITHAYKMALSECLDAWQKSEMTDAQARFLGFFVRNNLLPNQIGGDLKLKDLKAEYVRLESQVPVPTRVPGILEAESRDQPVFKRGNHDRPGQIVPRRYLEAFDPSPFASSQSGRLELAKHITEAKNPLFARVMVNRIWHHVFGKGIVSTTDNFGRLGAQPTHPQLLDYLANRFQADDYSIKKMIRRLVTSNTFRLESVAKPSAVKIDPGNIYLSHMRVRRLEAEAIRDKLLAVSGRLDRKMYGESTNGDSNRRGVYVRVQRNRLDPFLNTFDAPAPFTTKGTRDVTNVPAQSLALMNDPWVDQLARSWSETVEQTASAKDDATRIRLFFESAFGRKPARHELEQSLAFIKKTKINSEATRQQLAGFQQSLVDVEAQIDRIVQPIRVKLSKKSDTVKPTDKQQPQPISQWGFDNDMRDSVGDLHGQAVDNAKVADGKLVLDGASFVATLPLKKDLMEKTLEVWVTLGDIDQQGGGAMTVQTLDGATFDSIVFAERRKKQWMAGSNGFARTQDFDGSKESQQSKTEVVHIVIVYSVDGTITCYRNGQIYGQPYKSSGPIKFLANETQILFGLRHGTRAKRTTHLTGAIHLARLYDRALSPKDVELLAQSSSEFVSNKQILASMSDKQKQEFAELISKQSQFQNKLGEYEIDGKIPVVDAWHEFAKALFSFKEFIYVR